MKNILFSFLLMVGFTSWGQAPQGINYQGVARDNLGQAISKTNISLQIKIYQGDPSLGGTVVYDEFHTGVKTDTFGLYSLVIGSKSGTGTGTFTGIAWSSGNKWVQVLIDPSNGTAFSLVASQQLMSVPYALYAETAGSGGSGSISGTPNNLPKINTGGNGVANSAVYDNGSGIGINTTSPQPGAALDISSTSKALLVPRMTGAQRTSMTVKHHGSLVFQTDNAGLTSPEGFWYYDSVGTAWLLMAPAQAVWTLSGNAVGTSSFLGSLDNNDVIFKTGLISATERMRIFNSTKGGNVQFGDGTSANSYVFPATKGSAGDILQLDPTGTSNNLVWKSFTGSGNIAWLTGGNPGALADFLGTTGAFPLNISTTNTVTPQPIIFSTNNTEQMRLNGPNGLLGVGTNTPAARLHVADNSSLGPQVYIQNTAQSQEATAKLSAIDFGGNAIETVVGSVDGGNAISAVGRLGTISNHDLVFINGITKTEQMRITVGGNTGIGINNPTHKLEVAATSSVPVVFAINNSTGPGDAMRGVSSGTGSGIFGTSTAGGNAVSGVANGGGNAGSFLVASSSNTSAALSVSHQGAGPIGVFTNTQTSNTSSGIDVTSVGGGSSLFATNTGTGSAGNFVVNNQNNNSAVINASTNGKGSTANLQNTNSANNSAVVNINTNGTGPALAASGGGTAPAGIFMGGAVGVATNAPTSGLDVKTSFALSVKKYSAPGNYTILLNDQNVVHLAAGSGSFTFNLPDATLCPGRLLVFSSDGSGTGGSVVLSAMGSQTVNGSSSQSFTISTGVTKPSFGIISDGSNWQIIFKN